MVNTKFSHTIMYITNEWKGMYPETMGYSTSFVKNVTLKKIRHSKLLCIMTLNLYENSFQ